MKVVVNTWAGAFFNPGGGETQLNETVSHLREFKVATEPYNQWNPQRELDVFHQFSIQPGVQFPMYEYRALKKPIVLSTILWATLDPQGFEHQRIRQIFDFADLYFTNSKAESKKIATDFGLDLAKFHETRNGVADVYLNRETTADFRALFKLPSDFVLSVANVDDRKNTKRLIEACARLKRSLVLVGHVRDQQYFKDCGQYGPFTYVGPITDANILKSAYQQASLFALPSLCETPGIAALEAGSQGAKIVITNEGSTEEYFGDLATYTSPRSVDAICEAIEKESKRSRDRDEVAKHVTTNFTWTFAARDVHEGYLKALKGKR